MFGRSAATGASEGEIVVTTAMLHLLFVAINARIAEAAGPGDPTSDATGLRPLTPRSIVLSVLLGSRPPELPVAALVEFTSLFGIAPGACRTALSRMVTAGELDTDDGVYRLGERLQERRRQQESGRRPAPAGWDGTWWFATVVADRRTTAERRAHRHRMLGARFGELRPDTWLRPANLPAPEGLALLTRGPIVAGDEGDLVRRLWDLDALDARTDTLHSALDRVAADLARTTSSGDGQETTVGDGLADAFVALAAALRHLRSEPQLPSTLAPSDRADRLRSTYASVERRFQTELAGFFARRGVSTAGR